MAYSSLQAALASSPSRSDSSEYSELFLCRDPGSAVTFRDQVRVRDTLLAVTFSHPYPLSC